MLENPSRQQALDKLEADSRQGIERRLILEGSTCADCLIECENAVIWVEGKRHDWLDYSATWDVTRDQLARNAEAAWLYAQQLGKESCVVVCYESQLKHHEELLLNGYRHGTWPSGWPHLTAAERDNLGERIGTVTWQRIAAEWPPIADLLQ